MADFSGSGAFSGAAAGASIGSAFAPGIGTAIGAGLGALGGGLFGGTRSSVPDISGELARIRALIAQARESAIASINKQAALGRSDAASNLAARGIYSSPVSQNTFNRLEDSRLNAISDVSGKFAGQEADLSTQLLEKLLGYKIQDNMLGNQISAGRVGAGTSLLLKLLTGGGAGVGGPGVGGTSPNLGASFMTALSAPAYSGAGGGVPYYLTR